MNEFNFKPGDKIREPRWNPRSYVHIVALGDDTFIGRIQTGECLYRKDGDWERYVEPEPAPCKQFTIDTERRIPRLGDDVVLLHGGTPHWVMLLRRHQDHRGRPASGDPIEWRPGWV
jgi:hypothetical protein